MKKTYYELYDIVKKYCKNHEHPIFLSDWDTSEPILRPKGLIEKSLLESLNNIDSYYFMEEDQGKGVFLDYCDHKFHEHGITRDKFVISPNATMSISLSIMALKDIGVHSFLSLSPVYFTFDIIFRILNCSYDKMPISSFYNNFEKLEEHVVENKIQAIIITDPHYGSGVSLTKEDYYKLQKLAIKKDLWLILDYARGGFHWDKGKIELFDFDKYKTLSSYSKFIFIDSISKKLFINGFKTSLLISSPDIIHRCELLADGFVGSICASEIRVFENIYKIDNENQIKNMMIENMNKVKQVYELLNSIVLGTNIELSLPDDGNYCLCSLPKQLFHISDDCEIFKKLLYDCGIYTLPQSLYYDENKIYYAFRVNLLQDKKTLLLAFTRLCEII